MKFHPLINDCLNIKKFIQSKKEYRKFSLRVRALPTDYRFVFKKIQRYMWQFSTGPGHDMMQLQNQLLCLFEKESAEGKNVLDITGNDVAAFADQLLKDVRTYTNDWRTALNKDIHSKIKPHSS